MGLYWRRSTKILPGVRVNWSKSGPSVSVGPKGAKVNFGKRGTYVSGGIPGTGLYYRQKIGGKKPNQPNTTPNGLYNSNSNVASGISSKGCCFTLLIVIAFALLVTGNFLTCLLYTILVGVIIGIYYLTKNLRVQKTSLPPTQNIDNSTPVVDNDKDEESIDVKIALAEVDHLISLIDKSTDKIELPSNYRKLMSIIMKLEENGNIKIQGLPIDVAKSRILENYRKRMNS